MRQYRYIYLLLVVLVMGLVMAGCGSKGKKPDPGADTKPAMSNVTETSSAPPAPAVDRTGWPVIVAFGDSLTAGLGVSVEENYPSQLQAELDRQGYKYRVVNAGISGDETGGGVSRVDSVLSHKPGIVILELGANDGLRGKPVQNVKENLTQIVERLQKEGVQVVLAGMQIPPNYGPEYTEAFQKTYEEVAATHKVPLIPFFLDGVAGKPELNRPDGIHPTGEGYVFVVRNVMSVLQPLLKK